MSDRGIMASMIATTDLAEQMAAHQEAWLLGVFGTRENAERLAHLYVLDYEPIAIETEGPSVRATQVCRLRLKTQEELAAEEGHAAN